MKPGSHKHKILRHLKKFGKIDPMTSLHDYGILRLAPRIEELRHQFGYEINTQIIKSVNRFGEDVRYAVYSLAGVEPPKPVITKVKRYNRQPSLFGGV